MNGRFLLLTVGLTLAASAAVRAENPKIAAVRMAAPPVIDGAIQEDEWRGVPVLTKFVDPFTGQPAADQTEAWIGFDDVGLNVAFRCYDSNPAAMVGREIQPGAEFSGEDTVTFKINPFGTHTWDGRSEFTVNLLNTQSDYIAGGRAAKREWRGEWMSATKRLPNGWSVEIRIPWNVFNYPSGDKLTMDVNFQRFQARNRVGSVWANTTQSDQPQLMGYWEGVIPPKRAWKPRIQSLGYLAPGWDGDRFEFRSGLDVRVQPTPTLSGLVSVNPDFRNIEGQVAGVGFTRTERFLNDVRPFFSEGGDYFSLGEYFAFGSMFYSNRIGGFDYGAKAYGKITPRTSISALTTVETNQATASVVRLNQTVGAQGELQAYATRYDTPKEGENLASGVHAFQQQGNWNGGIDVAQESQNGSSDSAGSASVGYRVPGWFGIVRTMWIEPTFAPSLAYIPWTNRKGGYGFFERFVEFRHGPTRDLYAWLELTNYGDYGGRLQQRGVSSGYGFTLRNDMHVSVSRNQTQFADGVDSTVGLDLSVNSSNRYRRFGVYLESGQRASDPSRFISYSGTLRVLRRVDLGFSRSRLEWRGHEDLTVATLGYELSRTRSISGRVVERNGRSNVYFAFRNGGSSGAELYVIVGEPNADRTQNRVSVKYVWPF